MENPTIEDIKNSIIILALDNLASLCEESLEIDENNPEEQDYLSFLASISRDIIKELGGYTPHVIPRPKWKTK